MKPGKKLQSLTLVLTLALSACSRSHIVLVTLWNASGKPLSNITVDYPEATFGKSSLGPGDTFQYKIKVTDNGPLKVSFTSASGLHISNSTGPLHKNDEGTIEIKLSQETSVPVMHLGAPR